jgi:GNAT superfamily N-acetyltransferase
VTAPQIHRATTDDATRVAALIDAAFHTLDAAVWLVADPDERARVLPANLEIYVDYALTRGEVDLIEAASGEPAAAAVWLPQLSGLIPPPNDYEDRLVAACGPYTERFRTLDDLFYKHHPHVYPHHHLAFLATVPDRQGHGLGAALLRHHHSRLDHDGMPAFLQASSQRSRALYERHGYACLGDPFYLPGGPPFWPMVRRPVAHSE